MMKIIIVIMAAIICSMGAVIEIRGRRLADCKKALDRYAKAAEEEIEHIRDVYEEKIKNIESRTNDYVRRLDEAEAEKKKEIEKLKNEKKDLLNADAKNVGLYYKIADLSNENARLKEMINQLKIKR